MVKKQVDWTKLNAMRQQAIRDGRPPITAKELTNLCHLAGVVFVTSHMTDMYYQIRERETNSILLEIGKQRSAPEFVEAFRGLGLL